MEMRVNTIVVYIFYFVKFSSLKLIYYPQNTGLSTNSPTSKHQSGKSSTATIKSSEDATHTGHTHADGNEGDKSHSSSFLGNFFVDSASSHIKPSWVAPTRYTHTLIHTYIHTYIHRYTYIHTYIHTNNNIHHHRRWQKDEKILATFDVKRLQLHMVDGGQLILTTCGLHFHITKLISKSTLPHPKARTHEMI